MLKNRDEKILLQHDINHLKPTVYVMHHHLTFNNFTLCPHRIYLLCIYLRTNSNLCHLHDKLIGFYNRDEKCLQRGKDWVFRYSGLRFIFKRLKQLTHSNATQYCAV